MDLDNNHQLIKNCYCLQCSRKPLYYTHPSNIFYRLAL